MPQRLSVYEVEYIAYEVAKRHLEWDEPIPDFSTRYPEKLESCLETPFMQFGEKDLYKGIYRKAAALFYLLIKNHPFQNGNKRLAVTTLLVFLQKNGKWIDVDTVQFYKFAVWVAESPPNLNKEVIDLIEKFIVKSVISY
jgi:death-on-curing family protein